MSLLQTKNLVKTYVNGDVITPVLYGVDIDVREGEFVALMGPSGSGKSTLMHILGFLDRPTSGSYRFADEEVASLADDAQAKRRSNDAGFVFQAFHLLPRLTALENVMLPLAYQNVPVAERKTRATKLLSDMGLADRLDHVPNQLSGGQKQRVAIARALVTEPKVIFADEPTGNLDSASSAQVLNLLRGLHVSGKTIVMVTHEPEAAAFASRIIRMKDGRIVA
ncbi:MAG: ABC transporter ATP-binding protein [Candidatus Uhrbacteria bacterium]|nr:ABC transporter ATP-binding protein [Candidatus Uhrbacteria bacterium]